MHHLRQSYKFTMLFLFTSSLSWGLTSWGLTSEENLKKIEVLQKKCLRIMTFSDFGCHTNNLFIQHKILKVREIIKLHQMQLVYNFLDKVLLSDLRRLFTLNGEIHTDHTRQVFHVPDVDTSRYGINSLKVHCPNLWNNTWNCR